MIAYFDTDGELLGSARNISFSEVPMAVTTLFDKHFAEFDPLEVLEVSNTEGAFYSITMETENKRYHVKVDADGNILNIVKVKKVKPINA